MSWITSSSQSSKRSERLYAKDSAKAAVDAPLRGSLNNFRHGSESGGPRITGSRFPECLCLVGSLLGAGSTRAARRSEKHYEKGNAKGAAQSSLGVHLSDFRHGAEAGGSKLSGSRFPQCICLVGSLLAAGGTQAVAFPNVGINLQEAIQKQEHVLKEQDPARGFEFGILGSVEIETASHKFQSNWRDLLTRIRNEVPTYESCDSAASNCNPKLRKWRELLAELKGLPTGVQLARLNKSVNRLARYADDSETFGKRDYWATPLEFLKGRADCEDYAAVKFWSLLELGYSNDQLRLAVVRDQRRGILHAIVTVDAGEKKFVLDSLFDHVVDERYVLKYAPVYSANLDSQFAHIVNKRLRVAYLNQLEDRNKGRVIAATARRVSKPGSKVTSTQSKPISVASTYFVDWT